MSTKEFDRIRALAQVQSKQISKTEAARRLGITRQHIDRLYKTFCREGEEGLISKKRGQPSNNRIPDSVRKAVIKIIREQYSDFKPGFAHEKLTEVHGFKLSDEKVRQIMVDAGIWKGKKRKHPRVHQMRPRRSARGELIQLDGSPHDWFEGHRAPCCLLVLIDDASSEIMGLRFVENECLQGYFDLTREYIERCGRPVALYSDRHSIFQVNIQEALSGTGETQFGRAMSSLDIELILANSPQAKGRAERANQTLQDRLIKEMRLSGIHDIESANAWLPQFIKKHNHRFAVAPASPIDAHRKAIPKSAELDYIFCVQTQRKLSKNLELSYKNVIYQIQTKSPGYMMRGAFVTVCESPSQVILLYKNKPQPYKTFDKNNRPKQVLDSKDLNAHLDKRTIGRKPRPDHPWCRGFAS
jgi:transposase